MRPADDMNQAVKEERRQRNEYRNDRSRGSQIAAGSRDPVMTPRAGGWRQAGRGRCAERRATSDEERGGQMRDARREMTIRIRPTRLYHESVRHAGGGAECIFIRLNDDSSEASWLVLYVANSN